LRALPLRIADRESSNIAKSGAGIRFSGNMTLQTAATTDST
jgi:hypothetical protein